MTDSTLLAKSVVAFLTGMYPGAGYVVKHRDVMTITDLGSVPAAKKFLDLFELGYTALPPLDRSADDFDVRLAVVLRERYPETPDPEFVVPMAWTEERKQYFEDIFNLLTNSRTKYITLNTTGEMSEWYCMTGEVTTIYDYAKLDKHKVFWAEMEVVYRKSVEANLDPNATLTGATLIAGNTALRLTFSKPLVIPSSPVEWHYQSGPQDTGLNGMFLQADGSYIVTFNDDDLLAPGQFVIPPDTPSVRTFLGGYVNGINFGPIL